jgi:hypothetical protein
MGHKLLCLDCKKSENLGTDLRNLVESNCTKCKKQMILMPHRFRPPKKADEKSWQVVRFLVENGFKYQHIYQEGSNELISKPTNNYVSYPTNMRDAKEFIEKYKEYARL